MTEPLPLQQVERTFVRYNGRKLAYFAGCDYFRLASHPKVLAALQFALKTYGLNVAASRLTTGNHILYGELETHAANFFGAAAATLVSNGCLTNFVVAQALAGDFSHALIDEASHPSLSQAARFLDCPIFKFRSRDPEDLARAIRRYGRKANVLVLTDGMFSRDGSAAPLKEYLEVLPAQGRILVDDAHGAGVLGRTGKGTLEYAGVSRRRIIQTGTFSKAFGAFGGVILGPPALRSQILGRSLLFAGSTPLPLPLANAALEGMKVLAADPRLRERLARNSAYVKGALRKAGLALPEAPGPIVAVVADDQSQARRLQQALLASGIYPPFIHYPGGPPGGYFRFVISSEHSQAQLDRLIEVVGAHLQYITTERTG